MKFVYLHGFASSPESRKAVYLRQAFANRAISLEVPDLNQGDFSHLTITRQLRQVEMMLPQAGTPVTLIGSSLGGLTSAWLGQKRSQIQRLVLLAPAFGFLDHWLPQLGEAQLQQWQDSGYMPVYHYQEKRSLPLHYNFVEDARQYQSDELWRVVPTLILHGRHDETIPIDASRQYAKERSWVELIELTSDHYLKDVMPEIWQEIRNFCQLI
ncbi:MAG: alpha/beta fold hydrolase [Symploca sp. SIO2E6]|nr:alpha/beta fold hydrolase [Symploca sp. SIO2E6]